MADESDPHDLERFVAAQRPLAETVERELRRGRKETHWMWFVFPQVAGLGSSAHAVRYAIRSRAEAAAYLAHPLLGPRLRDWTALVCGHAGRPIGAIFGAPDDLKFRSSMTLFDAVAPGEIFGRALDLFFAGARDRATLDRL
ncbi:DUF1810 domain-containing protein [Prosthecomicrobium pneumaticum]|uniref:Uncharacterized protein (DUF1810 family) n=1 Tax=Prosthecomicrobium pneumaticum TaxID=81895 RepID=A0A7W9CU42_9HYPH|nr:DUF1810 domain-containing protein [Prosthecomicrobium pneumaticum]MBB5751935.1 uncharacterized protein (DUF1810 family) [Prosthecomicrobium pneumaticum]